jgi:hypothetical protein
LRIRAFGLIPVDDESIIEISEIGLWTPAGYNSDYFNIATGDVDGNALRLGRPQIKDQYEVVQPAVILNAPPVHFDVLKDTFNVRQDTFDVCQVFNLPHGTDPVFFAQYEVEQSTEKIIETEFHRDWGVSASLTNKFFIAGNGIKGRLAGYYGEGFSKIDTDVQNISVSVSSKADLDDSIYTYSTNWSLTRWTRLESLLLCS